MYLYRTAPQTATVFVKVSRPMSEEQITAHIAGRSWEGKAGAYAIQETADQYVERVEGSFTNVVGLPMERTLAMLAEAGLTP